MNNKKIEQMTRFKIIINNATLNKSPWEYGMYKV